jgi:hypothetical protein
MGKMPRALIGTKPKISLKLEGRDTFLGRAHEMKGYNPLADGDMGRFHNGSHGHGKGFPAGRAFIEAVPVRFSINRPRSLMAAMRTDRTIGPKDFLNVFAGFFFCQFGDFDQIHLNFPLYRIFLYKYNTDFWVCQADNADILYST